MDELMGDEDRFDPSHKGLWRKLCDFPADGNQKHTIPVCFEPASASDLVEALDGTQIEHYCIMHEGRVWGYPDVSECTFQRYQRANLGQAAETSCDIQRVVVVPLGEDADE